MTEGNLSLPGTALLPTSGIDRRPEIVLRGAVVACVLSTLWVLTTSAEPHWVLPTIDLVLDTVALLVSGLLTALAWARYRERRIVTAAVHASAFLALTVAYGLAVFESLLHSSSIPALARPQDFQASVFATARLAAAMLLVLAGPLSSRPRQGRWLAWAIWVPALVVLLVAVLGAWLGSPLEAFRIIRSSGGSELPTITPFGAAIHLLTAGLFFAGAWVSRTLWRTGQASFDAWLAIGLVFAGFAELQWIAHPSGHPGQISTADLLRLACSFTLLVGLESSVRAGLRELQAANVELAHLRDAEGERAALEERARLARELHDGLAQDLWLAKLRAGALASMDELPSEVRRVADEAVAAIDVGLSDAREAVAALRSAASADSGFCALIRSAAEEYGDRFGLRVEFACEGDRTAPIAPRTQAEILRITQEALSNVARHADATVVGVRLSIREGRIRLRVVDNGRGFDQAVPRPGSFGFTSMRERAAIIGGRIRTVSRTGAGTGVILAAPLITPAVTLEAERE